MEQGEKGDWPTLESLGCRSRIAWCQERDEVGDGHCEERRGRCIEEGSEVIAEPEAV